jgi:hypothetical protein
MYDPSAPPLVSETLLKTRRTLDELSHRRSTTVQVQNKVKRAAQAAFFSLRFFVFLTQFTFLVLLEKESRQRRGCPHQAT